MGTYADPSRAAAGMDWVFVGGCPVLREGRRTGERPGGVLRR